MAGRASFIELSRRALAGDEDALISLRTEDADVPDKDLLRRAQNRINRLDQQEARVPVEKPQPSIKAYHGTPHVFPNAQVVLDIDTGMEYVRRMDDPIIKNLMTKEPDRFQVLQENELGVFDLSKVGTGEGAQAYGYGGYLAGGKETARGYRSSLLGQHGIEDTITIDGKPLSDLYTDLMNQEAKGASDANEKMQILEDLEFGGDVLAVEEAIKAKDYSDATVKWFDSIKPTIERPGALYEVNINADKSDLLDWDAEYADQSGKVKNSIEKYRDGIEQFLEDYTTISPDLDSLDGQYIYNTMRRALEYDYIDVPKDIMSAIEQGSSDKAVSMLLNRDGVMGINYLDGVSRRKGEGINNYVIFDPKILEISKKYGVSIPLAGALLANTEETQAQNLDDININEALDFWEPEFFQDDLDPQVLEAREQANTESGAYAQLMADKRAREAATETAEADQIATRDLAVLGPGGTAVAGLSKIIDLDPVGTVIELPRQILAGSLDALTEAATTLNEMFPLGPEEGFQFEIEAEPRTVLGAGARGISQFMTGFIPALKAVKTLKIAETARKAGKAAGAAGTITEGAIAGALTDAFAFDPDEERLSNLIKDLGIETPVTDYLAASPDDTRAEGRVKNALEGLALGGIADGLMTAFRMYKARKPIQEAAQEQGKSVDELVNEAMQSYKGGADYVEPALRMPEDQEFLPFDEALDVVQPTIRLNAPSGSTLADPEDAQNINLGRLDTTDDVKDLLDSVAIADADTINEARGQKITNAELVDLAEQVGMTPEMLLKRRPREAFTAEEALAARQILVASGENIIRLAKQAEVGGDLELALLRRAMAQHQAIQHQVAGMTAEAGRALQSFRIQAASTKEQQRAIEDAINDSGGFDINKQLAKRLGQLENSKEVGQVLSQMHGNRWWNASSELFINGILSGAPTHMANVSSNLFVNALTVSERKVASLFGDSIQPGEADAMLVGMVHGMRDGFRLGWQALRTGEPSDQFVKIDTNKYKAIAGEKFGLTGPLGRVVDYMGIAIRTSGRLLTAEDEFFKAVGYRMELHAQAYRTAFNEGLTGDEAAARVAEIINNPPQNIKMASIDAARYGTFTNSVEGMKIRRTKGLREAAERGKAEIPESRVILPFISTPSNIMSFGLERTPISMFSRGVKEELEAGGARRDLALAKIATGSMIMAVSADLALSGSITGGGPANRDMKNLLRATGWQPYSIKVGNTYYAYNRLDPLGMTIGLAADMTEIIGQKDEYDAQQIAVATTLALFQNLSSKTYLSSFTEFLDAFMSASDDPDSQNYKMERWLNRAAGGFIPFSSAMRSVERVMDPTVRIGFDQGTINNFLRRVQTGIPGYSEDLPPRRNIFGDIIVLEGGIGPDIMSPVYQSEVKDNPVAEEMVRQRALAGMPRANIRGVDLDPWQYDRYVQLTAGVGDDGTPSLYFKLDELIHSPRYKRMTDGRDGTKRKEILSVIDKYRTSAREALLREDVSLKLAIQNAEKEKQNKARGN